MRWAIVLVGCSACYAPDAITGAPCSTNQTCPAGQACIDSVCGGRAIDAPANTDMPIAIDGAIDAAIDGPIDTAMRVPWMLVQTHESMTSTMAIDGTVAGNTIIVAIETNVTSAVNAISDDAGNTYLAIPNTRAVDASDKLGLELWYANNVAAGANAISVMTNNFHGAVMWEVANLDSIDPLDVSAHLDDGATSNTPVGASITTTRAGDFVVSAIIVSNQVSGLVNGSPFNEDWETNANGFAHLVDSKAPIGTYQAQWNQPTTGDSCASSAAFRIGP